MHIPGRSYGAFTDAQGNFKLNHVPPGSYTLLVQEGSQVLSSVANVLVEKGKVTDLGVHNFCPDNCTDADEDGFSAQPSGCGLTDCDDANKLIHPGASEICDDLDNDCNGLVDEGCLACIPGGTCYTGPPGTELIGQCSSGGYDNLCQQCVGETTPQNEICDGVDNDCNGVVDEGCAGFCNVPADCPDSACEAPTCVNNTCGVNVMPQGTLCPISEGVSGFCDGVGTCNAPP